MTNKDLPLSDAQKNDSDPPSRSMRLRLVLAEDHALVLQGFKALLEQEPSFEIVGEASNGLEAVQVVEKTKPDVLLLDLRIPHLHGIDVLRQVHERTKTKVVIVSMYSDEPYLIEAMRTDVSGYVLKDCPPEELIRAIRAVASGRQYICESLRQKALSGALKRVVSGTSGGHLTKREYAVLELAAQGKTSSQIASELVVSRRTAEAHRANLMKKLGLKTQTDLVLYAIRSELISP